jgi:hypothetical protein
MKAFAPWASNRFIAGWIGDSGFFYVDGCKRLVRQLRCHDVCSLSFPTRPSPFPAVMPPCIPCTKHNDVAVMPGAAVAGVPPASSPAHPAVSFARCGHAAHHPIGLAWPAPIRPQGGSLLFHCAPEPSRPLASRRDCHGPGIRVSFFVRSGYRATSLCSDAPKPGSLPIASGASQTTAMRRLLCPCGLSYLSFVPVPADFASLRLPRPDVIAAIAVTRPPLRSGRDTSLRCFF